MEKFREFAISKTGNNATFNYRVGKCTYGEGLIDGVYRGFGFNGGGYNVNPDMMVNNGAIRDVEERCAFVVELDGQSLVSHWELVDTQREEADGVMNIRVILKNTKRPVEVTVCTKYDGSGCLSRWLEIKNCDTKSVTLGRLAPWCGMLEKTPEWKKMMQDKTADSCYRLGYFEYERHMHEGQFKWHDLHNDCYSFGGRYTRMRYRHPFFVLENKAKGTCYAAQLAYSGGYKFSFDFNPYPVEGNLAMVAEIDGTKPLRIVEAGETIVSPEFIVAMVNGDMDMAINSMHEHIRSAVMMKPHGPGCYTEAGMGGTIETCKKGALKAKERGFDIVYIDAGWYYPEGESWLDWVGNWEPDPKRFPNGLKELSEYCHSIGIKMGLWMEPERLGGKPAKAEADLDKCIKDHCDNLMGRIGGKGGLYDLSRKEVADYIEAQICRMIENTGLDMFRLDFNVDYMAPYGYIDTEGYMESPDFKYCENFCAMFDRIRKKYPNVIFEGCASGGGRTDLGAVKYFDHTWVTDNPIAPRCFAITNGMTMCLPPELVDRLVTTMGAPNMGSLEFGLYQLMFVRPTSHFQRETPENPLTYGKFEQFMKLYNEFARPMLPKCRIYHHTPSQEDCEPKGVGILEEVSENCDRAMLGVFALADPCTDDQIVRFKGVDASKKYKITALSAEETFEVTGYELKYKGIHVALHGALTAELFLAEEIK